MTAACASRHVDDERPWDELIIPDATGCCHTLRCIEEIWQCGRCSRLLDWVWTSQGHRLKVLESLDVPNVGIEKCVLCDGALEDFDADVCRRCSKD